MPYFRQSRAAGVECDVAADGADRLARGIGREVHAEGAGRLGHVQVDRARLDDGDPLFWIELDDAIEPVEGDKQPVFDGQRRAGEAGAAAARDERHIVSVTDAHRLDHLVLRLGDHDRSRPYLVGGQRIRLVGRQLRGLDEQAVGRVDAS